MEEEASCMEWSTTFVRRYRALFVTTTVAASLFVLLIASGPSVAVSWQKGVSDSPSAQRTEEVQERRNFVMAHPLHQLEARQKQELRKEANSPRERRLGDRERESEIPLFVGGQALRARGGGEHDAYVLPFMEEEVPPCMAAEYAAIAGQEGSLGGMGPVALRRLLHKRHSMQDVHGFVHSREYDRFLQHLTSGALFAPGAKEWLDNIERRLHAAEGEGSDSQSSGPGEEEAASKGAPRQPDVLVVMADDLGFADLGYMLAENSVRTPVLDALAENAVHLDQHRSHTWCGPARGAFLTGVLNHNLGGSVKSRYNYSLGADEPMSAAFTASGYYTMISGKWHQASPVRPGLFVGEEVYDGTQGLFHYNTGFSGGTVKDSYYDRTRWRRNGVPMKDAGYATDIIAAEVVRKIEERHELEPERPLFMWASFNAPHNPTSAPYDLVDYYTREFFAEEEDFHQAATANPVPYRRLAYDAMVTALDRGVGAILEVSPSSSQISRFSLSSLTSLFFLSLLSL